MRNGRARESNQSLPAMMVGLPISNGADSEYGAMVLNIERPLKKDTPPPKPPLIKETRLRHGEVYTLRCLFPALGDPQPLLAPV